MVPNRIQRSAGRAPAQRRLSASGTAEGVEELAHPRKEARAFGLGLLRAFALEFLQKLALAPRQALRGLDHDLDVEIADVAGAQHRHALALEAELLARLRALRDLHLGVRTIERRHHDLAAERRRDHRDRHTAEEVGGVALEEGVRLDREEDVEIARRPALQPGLALAGEADPGAVLDARRHVDGEGALAGDAAGAAAIRA